MNIKIKNQKNNKGFSLVEMLVAIGIFMSIMTIAISSLISIIGANKKAQLIKSTIDSVTFAVENISREMRIGNNYKCMTASGFSTVCDLVEGSNEVQYTNSSGAPVSYKFNKGSQNLLTRTEAGVTADLISQDSGVNITNVRFYVIGADNELNPVMANRTQPRVIIIASGLIQIKGSTDTSFNIQTSVSQRVRK